MAQGKRKSHRDDGTKHCSSCDQWKPLADFAKNRARYDGLQHICKVCASKYRDPAKQRAYHLRTKYGLTVEEYEALVAAGCSICGRKGATVSVDHDHKNGKVRALLCQRCNIMLGQALDDPARLRAGAEYLEAWQREHA